MTRSALQMGIMMTALFCLPGSPSIAQDRPHINQRNLFDERSLSKDITDFGVDEQLGNTFYKADIIVVSLTGPDVPNSQSCGSHGMPNEQSVCGQYFANPAKFAVRHLKDMNIRVWVLKADGTALAQKQGTDGSLCKSGTCQDRMMFVFEHAAPSELAALVMQVDGKLIVRKIPAAH
jgi:hypothetical protein